MEQVLLSHSVKTLKSEISKANIKGYSKMKKPELVKLMIQHEDRFKHIEYVVKPSKPTVKTTKTVVKPTPVKPTPVKPTPIKPIEKPSKPVVKKRKQPKRTETKGGRTDETSLLLNKLKMPKEIFNDPEFRNVLKNLDI